MMGHELGCALARSSRSGRIASSLRLRWLRGLERGDGLDHLPDGGARRGGHVAAAGGGRDVDRRDAVPQFLLPASGRQLHDRRSAELGGAVRVSRGQPGGEQPVGGRAAHGPGSGGPPRRAGPAVRSEPRRADDDRQPGGAVGPGAVGRPAVRSGVRRRRGAARDGDWDVFEAGARARRARSAAADERVRGGAGVARVRRACPDLRRAPDDDGRRPRHPAGAAARRHEADRDPGRRRPSGGGRHARRAGGRRGDRDRTRAVPRRAQGGRADAAERTAEDGAARVARTRSCERR